MKAVNGACCVNTTQSQIKFEENKRKILFINQHGKPYIKVKVDGCAITQGLRCDNLLLSGDQLEERYVELKGTDVVHAIDQLNATILALGEHDGNRHAYVICTNVAPALDTRIQKCKKLFRIRFNSELVIKEKQHSVLLG